MTKLSTMTIAGVCLALLWHPALAQSTPTLDDDDRLNLQGVLALRKIAGAACESLDAVRGYDVQQKLVLARIEQKYPGFTWDLATASLVAKGAK